MGKVFGNKYLGIFGASNAVWKDLLHVSCSVLKLNFPFKSGSLKDLPLGRTESV